LQVVEHGHFRLRRAGARLRQKSEDGQEGEEAKHQANQKKMVQKACRTCVQGDRRYHLQGRGKTEWPKAVEGGRERPPEVRKKKEQAEPLQHVGQKQLWGPSDLNGGFYARN